MGTKNVSAVLTAQQQEIEILRRNVAVMSRGQDVALARHREARRDKMAAVEMCKEAAQRVDEVQAAAKAKFDAMETTLQARLAETEVKVTFARAAAQQLQESRDRLSESYDRDRNCIVDRKSVV